MHSVAANTADDLLRLCALTLADFICPSTLIFASLHFSQLCRALQPCRHFMQKILRKYVRAPMNPEKPCYDKIYLCASVRNVGKTLDHQGPCAPLCTGIRTLLAQEM